MQMFLLKVVLFSISLLLEGLNEFTGIQCLERVTSAIQLLCTMHWKMPISGELEEGLCLDGPPGAWCG